MLLYYVCSIIKYHIYLKAKIKMYLRLEIRIIIYYDNRYITINVIKCKPYNMHYTIVCVYTVLFRMYLIQIVHYIEITKYILNFYIKIVKIIFSIINYSNSDQNVQNCMKIACIYLSLIKIKHFQLK